MAKAFLFVLFSGFSVVLHASNVNVDAANFSVSEDNAGFTMEEKIRESLAQANALSCQELQALGPDLTFWQVVQTPVWKSFRGDDRDLNGLTYRLDGSLALKVSYVVSFLEVYCSCSSLSSSPLCMPLPNEYSITFGEYVLPLYVIYILYSWKSCFSTGEFPQFSDVIFTPMNVYTQAAVLLSTWNLMPAWWLALWLLTVVASACQVRMLRSFDFKSMVFKTENLDIAEYRRLLVQLILTVKIPSVCLTIIAIIWAYSVQSAYLSEYQIYSFLTMLAGTIQKIKLHFLKSSNTTEPLLADAKPIGVEVQANWALDG